VPGRELKALGLVPADLLAPAGAARSRPLLHRLLGIALAHYDVAWSYTLAIPRRQWRMRLACAWPLLIGQGTLDVLAADDNPFTATTPVKIARAAVRTILAGSRPTVWSNRALAAAAARRRARIVSHLEHRVDAAPASSVR